MSAFGPKRTSAVASNSIQKIASIGGMAVIGGSISLIDLETVSASDFTRWC